MAYPVYSPGSVISARNRIWRVDSQADSLLRATAIDSGAATQRTFYLPVEDVERSQLAPPSPDKVGSPAMHQLLLRAYRLSMLHGDAPLLSLQRSRVIPKDYQLVPVIMAMEMARVRMLIADDVGLGKTIEAGLILSELMARQRASRVLIVVPAQLREQWREALEYFFHISAPIISSYHRRKMGSSLPLGTNPWSYYDVLITSVDYAKQPEVKAEILDHPWDMVIVDEAHLVAKPHQSREDQSVSKERWSFAEDIAFNERIRHLLLLTATPHNGYTDTFASLLRLLDVGAVSGPQHDPYIHKDVARNHVCQRRRQDVELWFQDSPSRSPFPDRDQKEVFVAPSAYEAKAIQAVQDYGERILAHARQGSAHSQTLANWTVLHLHKRALSSPAALRQSLRNRKESLQQRLRERLAAGDGAPISEDVARANVLDEETGEHLDDEEASRRTDRLAFGAPEAIRAELDALDAVMEKAERVTRTRDSKLQKLLDATLLSRLQYVSPPRVILFTRYIDTLNYLEEQIARDDRYADTTVLTIDGRMNEAARHKTFLDFRRAGKAVLIATDAISEGINLQHAACQVIHYELPWNPNRLEQRNGRVDRFGQREPTVYIRTMVMDETLDASIMKVLVEKAMQIREDYGFSPPYFGDEVNIINLIRDHDIRLGPKQLTFDDLLSGRPTPDIGDPFSADTLDRIRGESFYGQTDVSLPEIERRLEETRETIGTREQIEAFVRSGLERFGCTMADNPDGTYQITISNTALQTASVGTTIDRATFDTERGLDDPDVTVLDLGHPLVRRLIEEVKQNTFRPGTDYYGRTGYVVTPETSEPTVMLHLLARYVVKTDPISIVEDLVPVAVTVYGHERLDRDTTERLLNADREPANRAEFEVQDALDEVMGLDRLDSMLSDAVERRRQQLISDRRALRERTTGDAQWLAGIDAIEIGSFDILAATAYF